MDVFLQEKDGDGRNRIGVISLWLNLVPFFFIYIIVGFYSSW
jgi:hypothetical protein